MSIPTNPLEEKWAKLYPPTPKPEAHQVCDGYSCMWCGRCPRGDYWKCPDEDKEVYEQYQKELREYLEKSDTLCELRIAIDGGDIDE